MAFFSNNAGNLLLTVRYLLLFICSNCKDKRFSEAIFSQRHLKLLLLLEHGGYKSGGILHVSLMWNGLSMKNSGHKGAKKKNWYRCKFCIEALPDSKRQYQMWQDINKLLCIFSATVFISCAVEVARSTNKIVNNRSHEIWKRHIAFERNVFKNNRFENDTRFGMMHHFMKEVMWKRHLGAFQISQELKICIIKQECIPVGCVPTATVAATRCHYWEVGQIPLDADPPWSKPGGSAEPAPPRCRPPRPWTEWLADTCLPLRSVTILFKELSIWYVVVYHILKNYMWFSKSTFFLKYHIAVL